MKDPTNDMDVTVVTTVGEIISTLIDEVEPRTLGRLMIEGLEPRDRANFIAGAQAAAAEEEEEEED